MNLPPRSVRIPLLIAFALLGAGVIHIRTNHSFSGSTRDICLDCGLQRNVRIRSWHGFRQADRVVYHTNWFAATHGNSAHCSHAWTNIQSSYSGRSHAHGQVAGYLELRMLLDTAELQSNLVLYAADTKRNPRTVWNRLATHYCQHARTNLAGVDEWRGQRDESFPGAFSNWLSQNYDWIATNGLKPSR